MTRKIGSALVVGAGISGIRAALDLAETGYGVTLIDKAPHIGGVLSQLDQQFPSDHCGMCKMLPLVDRDAGSQYCLRKGLFHENIDIMLSTELLSVTGEPGHFEVTLRQKPKWVDPERCIGCGACEDVCPVDVPDDFNKGLTLRKAIYLPVPHAIPNTYRIDSAACTRCNACLPVCPTDAIHLAEQERSRFRILVVDDELIVRDSLKEILEEEGYHVDMAESGPSALESLSRASYQIMLLDIKMPGMDGVEVLQKAKEMRPDLAVVMMTAYATVETAVDAMKIGALEYLIKPFEPDALIPMIQRIYEDFEVAKARKMEVGALVFCGGTAYYDPRDGKNPYGYGMLPNVVTSLEFERLCSGTGPFNGRLCRSSDGKAIERIAWIQCVGSRDLQLDADYCSNICCMFAIKEALLAKDKTGGRIEPVIFYMDLRTFGKSFQRYRDQAASHGVRFQRGRVHSVVSDRKSGGVRLDYADETGNRHSEVFDMLVLSVGQCATPESKEFAERMGISLNSWGFAQTIPFNFNRTSQEGIVMGGTFSGLRDIGESVIQASAAAANASRVIHSTGGSLTIQQHPVSGQADLMRASPRILVALCTCNDSLSGMIETEDIVANLTSDPAVKEIASIGQICTEQGWNQLVTLVEANRPNRLLIGTCLPYLYIRRLQELSRQVNLAPSLMEPVEIREPVLASLRNKSDSDSPAACSRLLSSIKQGIAKLKRIDPAPVETIPIQQRALVVGGGISGMTAALLIAEHGFPVDLIEESGQLGGNLNWIKKTLEGHPVAPMLKDTVQAVNKHPLIQVHTGTRIKTSFGQVGQFITTIEDAENGQQTIAHGVAILATGGTEATTTSYGYGTSNAIVTQKELEEKLKEETLDPRSLNIVVMIQCVDSREEPRNYCSRVCCGNALKQALHLKSQNPDLNIYILYRDMMSYGFMETYYTQARQAGVLFIQYEPGEKPNVVPDPAQLRVVVNEPIIGEKIEIEADLLVLATGIQPNLPRPLADGFGVGIDEDGFFQEAESKWRPVDALSEGIFAAGIVLSPKSIVESIATAEAAAQRTLRILTKDRLRSARVVAKVKQSICSRCERCIDVCPYGARQMDRDSEKLSINPVRCQGCGSCSVACPNGAAYVEGFSDAQALEFIDAAMTGA